MTTHWLFIWNLALDGSLLQPVPPAQPLIYGCRLLKIFDRDLLDKRVLLHLPVRCVDCLNCGCVTEHSDWLLPGHT